LNGRTVLSKLFEWATDQEILLANQAAVVKLPAERDQDRPEERRIAECERHGWIGLSADKNIIKTPQELAAMMESSSTYGVGKVCKLKGR